MATTAKVKSNSYFMIIATMNSGKQFKIPCRGYNLYSWLEFEKTLGLPHFHVEVPKEEYDGYYALTEEEKSVTIVPKKRKPRTR